MGIMEKKQGYIRLTDYLQKYWDDVKGEKLFPSLDCISASEIDDRIIDDVFILILHHHSNNHHFSTTHIGKNILKVGIKMITLLISAFLYLKPLEPLDNKITVTQFKYLDL